MAKSLEIPKRDKQGIDELFNAMQDAEINGENDYKQTAQMVQEMNARISIIKKSLAEVVQEQYQEYKRLYAAEKKALEPYEKCIAITKSKMQKWYTAEEKKRLEEQRRIQEEARKKAEEEKLRDAEYNDDEDILNEPIVTPKVEVEQPKVEGVSYREKWDFEVEDPKQVPREYLSIDQVKIRKVVTAMKGETRIPGIRVTCEKIPVLRGK